METKHASGKRRNQMVILACVTVIAMFLGSQAAADLYVTDGMPADNVLGQADFTSPTRPLETPITPAAYFASAPPTADTLYAPDSVLVDEANQRVFIADAGNNRVIIRGPSGTVALGQPDFTTNTGNTPCGGGAGGGAPTACGLKSASWLAFVGQYLAVADTLNARVVFYDGSDGFTTGEAAAYVLGQASFVTAINDSQCGGGPALAANACGMRNPYSLEFDDAHSLLYVGDDNDRVTVFDLSGGLTNGMAASKVLGQLNLTLHEPRDCNGVLYPNTGNLNFPTSADACGMQGPTDIEWVPNEGVLLIATNRTARVMGWNLGTADPLGAIVNGMPSDFVIGQPDFTSVLRQTGGTRLNWLNTVELDPANQRMFIGDYSNCRVLEYDTSAGVSSAAFGAMPTGVIGQPDLASGWDPSPGSQACGKATFDAGTSMFTVHQQIAAADTLFGVIGMAWDATNERLLVSDASNNRIMIYGTHVGGVPILVAGESDATGTTNLDGSETLTIIGATSNAYELTLPDGTQPLAGETAVQVEVVSGNKPGIEIEATLPVGTSKTVVMPYVSNRNYCIDDSVGAQIDTLGSCLAPKVKVNKTDIDGAGECFVWEGSDTICHTGTSLTIVGLEHSAVYALEDSDGDGVDDENDVCLGTDLNGPVPTSGTLRPNHLGDGTTTADGCNASQILACKGGNTTGEQKYGVSPGQQNVFANRLGWAQDVNPADGTPDCFQ